MQLNTNETWLKTLSIPVADFQHKISHLDPNTRLCLYELFLKQANSGPMTLETIKRFLIYRKIKRFSEEKLKNLLDEFAELVPGTNEFLLKDLIQPMTSLFVYRTIRNALGDEIANLPRSKRNKEFKNSCLYPVYKWFINGLYSVYNFAQVIDLYRSQNEREEKSSRIELCQKEEIFAAAPSEAPSQNSFREEKKSVDTNIKESPTPVMEISPQQKYDTVLSDASLSDSRKITKLVLLMEDLSDSLPEEVTPKLFEHPEEALYLFTQAAGNSDTFLRLMDLSEVFQDITENKPLAHPAPAPLLRPFNLHAYLATLPREKNKNPEESFT